MKIKAALGLIAGVILLLSAGMHSTVGWMAMNEQLAQTNAPPDFVQGLQAIWMFSGVVMLVFGILCINTFLKRFRGQPASTFAPVLISISYLAFSVWAEVLTGGDPFFVVFIIPAVLLAVASIP